MTKSAQSSDHLPGVDREQPVVVFESESNVPFTVKYFGLEPVWESKEVKPMVDAIEKYLKEISPYGTIGDFERRLAYITKRLSLNGENVLDDIRKVSDYLNLISERKKLERQIDEIAGRYSL